MKQSPLPHGRQKSKKENNKNIEKINSHKKKGELRMNKILSRANQHQLMGLIMNKINRPIYKKYQLTKNKLNKQKINSKIMLKIMIKKMKSFRKSNKMIIMMRRITNRLRKL